MKCLLSGLMTPSSHPTPEVKIRIETNLNDGRGSRRGVVDVGDVNCLAVGLVVAAGLKGRLRNPAVNGGTLAQVRRGHLGQTRFGSESETKDNELTKM